MEMKFDEIVLRDYRLSDVEDEVRWTNTDTAWFYPQTAVILHKSGQSLAADPPAPEIRFADLNAKSPDRAVLFRVFALVDGFPGGGFEILIQEIGGHHADMPGLGERRFLLETWSGNVRMLGCARKLGFVEVKRQKGAYVVDGKAYDGLTLEKRI